MLSDNIVMERPTGYSLRASDSLMVPRFNSIYSKNSIAYRGPVLWNEITIFGDEATSALARFHAGPLSWSNWNLEC